VKLKLLPAAAVHGTPMMKLNWEGRNTELVFLYAFLVKVQVLMKINALIATFSIISQICTPSL